ncbi:methyltransferase-domain-containing protein [Helicostylum pulchrum]|nr:methyltransferase-domain-containing protein [Helicostylum pulchrum]
MFFETSGWALPKSIATEKKEVVSNKSKLLKAAEPASKDGKVTHEADKIQAQLAALNDQPKPQEAEAPKAKQLRVRNKKRALEQDEEEAAAAEEPKREEPKQSNKKADNKKQNNKKAKTDKPAEKQPETKKDQQKKKLQDLLKKKNTPTQKSNNNSKPAEKKQPTKEAAPAAPVPAPAQKSIVDEDEGLTPLQRKMKEKLSGARFRWLNEQLYTTPGKHSYELFQEKPELFDQYHEGFRHQVESWPVNPVDVIIDQLKTLPKGTVIADLGCGDAMIAQTLTKQTVLSFDLIAKNDLVTACDITKLPLEANTVDVAVFSLSLMGTNYLDFLKEAHRVLKVGGELKIAEVVSRFSDLDSFITLLEGIGFDFMDKEDDNKMFVMLYFTKQPNFEQEDEDEDEVFSGLSKTQKRSLKKGAGFNNSKLKLQKKAQQLLKPCLYKKR